MKSQWFEYKDQAISLRKQGFSYGEITNLLSVPKSTLSHWLRNIELTEEQKVRLHQNYGNGLIKARFKAGQWHKAQKELRLQKAREEARNVLSKIPIDDNIVELALAMLYLGEGSKKGTTALGCSDPMIMQFFFIVLVHRFNIDPAKMRFDLHIRADQNPDEIRQYWADELHLPISYFKYVVADKRTEGRASYPHYKGVCVINCGTVAIQRRLISLYNQFCEKVLNEWAISSVG